MISRESQLSWVVVSIGIMLIGIMFHDIEILFVGGLALCLFIFTPLVKKACRTILGMLIVNLGAIAMIFGVIGRWVIQDHMPSWLLGGIGIAVMIALAVLVLAELLVGKDERLQDRRLEGGDLSLVGLIPQHVSC